MRRLLAPIPSGSTINSRDELIYQSLTGENDWSNHSSEWPLCTTRHQRWSRFLFTKRTKNIQPAKSSDFVDWDVGPKVFCGDVSSLEVDVLDAIANRCVLRQWSNHLGVLSE